MLTAHSSSHLSDRRFVNNPEPATGTVAPVAFILPIPYLDTY